jgi:hypothetical protein
MITTMGHKRLSWNIIVKMREPEEEVHLLHTNACIVLSSSKVVPPITNCNKCGGKFVGVDEEVDIFVILNCHSSA